MTDKQKTLVGMPVFDARSVSFVAAFPDKGQIAIAFEQSSQEPGVTVMLPAGAVGHMVAQLRAEYAKIALSRADDRAVMLPLVLTGARPFRDPDGSPVLLLQFDGVFELAMQLTIRQAENLTSVSQRLAEPMSGLSSKPN